MQFQESVIVATCRSKTGHSCAVIYGDDTIDQALLAVRQFRHDGLLTSLEQLIMIDKILYEGPGPDGDDGISIENIKRSPKG